MASNSISLLSRFSKIAPKHMLKGSVTYSSSSSSSMWNYGNIGGDGGDGTKRTSHLFCKNSENSSTKKRWMSLVPIVLESGAGGERSFDIYSRLLRERIVCVHGEVTDQMASLVTAQLLFLEAEAPDKPVYMYINSPGGLVTAGMAMYDTMQYIGPEVHTICMGQAASMGSLLLAGGSPGCRFALPHARIMLHQPSGGAQGMAADIEIQAKEILRLRATLNDLYVHHTGQQLSEIERVMERDFFMGVEQALEFGIIDEILNKRKNDESSSDVTKKTHNK